MSKYPTAADMGRRWSQLAAQIASTYLDKSPHSNGIASDPSPKGELVILGSGLGHYDRTADTEAELASADFVFYCLYDQVAQVWITRLRPDAFDLSALYDFRIPRYQTYVRMAEALLFYVRKGKKVAAIYYGHPGVFATPAHRAIYLARTEGHHARMRPGISALDYLVADVGFDPALPGLLSYEASDMLLRQRLIDTSLHLVLWQVGVVGEFGFNPHGFENRGFLILVEALEKAYGPDWRIIHYIAPQYAGIEPLIEHFAIRDLRGDGARKNLSPLSTFYIPPRDMVATSPVMSVDLGLTLPGQPIAPPQRGYQSTEYGIDELQSLATFADFEISSAYSIPQSSTAVDFLIRLGEKPELLKMYRESPLDAVEQVIGRSTSPRVKRLLAINHPSSISTAIAEAAYEVEEHDKSTTAE